MAGDSTLKGGWHRGRFAHTFAAIDLGTNNCRLLVARASVSGSRSSTPTRPWEASVPNRSDSPKRFLRKLKSKKRQRFVGRAARKNHSAGNTASTPFFFTRTTMNFAGFVALALRPTVCTSSGPS